MIIVNFGFYNPKSGGLAKSTLLLAKFLINNGISFRVILPKSFRQYEELNEFHEYVIAANKFKGFFAIIYDVFVQFYIKYNYKSNALVVYDGFWPLIKCSNVLITVHDLYFIKSRWQFEGFKPALYSFYWKYSLISLVGQRDVCFRFISHTTEMDFYEVFGRSQPFMKSYMLYHKGFDLKNEVLSTTNVFNSSLITVGSISSRKNMDFLVQTAEINGVDLIVVGANIGEHRHKNSERVTFLGFISNNALKQQIVSSVAFVIASRCEGFSFPVVESLTLGTPVLAPNISVFTELLPWAFLYEVDSHTDFLIKFNYIRANRTSVVSRQQAHLKQILNQDDTFEFLSYLGRFTYES